MKAINKLCKAAGWPQMLSHKETEQIRKLAERRQCPHGNTLQMEGIRTAWRPQKRCKENLQERTHQVSRQIEQIKNMDKVPS